MENKVEALRLEVERQLAQLEVPVAPAQLYDPIRYILGLGGKRIRPILTAMGCALMGGRPKDAVNQALAVEIFHNFTLIHDDIMDRADVRRGVPTVHKKWNDNVAILSGDTMMVIAYQYLFKAKEEHLSALAEVFSATALEVCEGQQLDMDYAQLDQVSIENYMDMIRKKTAVLLGGAMQLGAIVAGADAHQLSSLKDFAEHMGLAFQIRDDYLDSFGDAASFGKVIGGDIREGKRTWLTIKAFELANEAQMAELRAAYVSADLDKRVERVLAMYSALNIAALAQAEIERYSALSAAELDAIKGDVSIKQQLRGLVAALMGRTS